MSAPQNDAYTAGLEVIRKEYRAHMRRRGSKIYLTVYWESPDLRNMMSHYYDVGNLVRSIWPDAYVTSAAMMSQATFRLNP